MSDEFNWRECYAAYINLSHRKDRRLKMEEELSRVGIQMPRFEAIRTIDYNWDEKKYGVMLRRSPGAVGCHVSQCQVMSAGLLYNKSAWICEDDLIFCTDIKERLDYIQRFLNEQEEWDIFFLGGTVHTNPAWWHKPGHSSDLQVCDCELGRDAETTGYKNIFRVYGMFSTHSYIVNVKSIKKILKYFDENVHLSMGIDWLTIKMQPKLKAYCFLPGSIKQHDNMSDIGQGMTIFSGFSKLGPYWWTDMTNEFDPSTYNWGEANIQK